jgi:hypothetical protein
MTYAALLGLVWTSALTAASLPFHVDEADIKVILRENQTAVRLPLRNDSGRTVTASLELAWLTPSGTAVSKQNRSLDIPPGESRPVFAFPLPTTAKDDKIWFRLRYRFRSEGAEDGGTLSLANSADHVFELRLSAPYIARPGEICRVRVSTRHPVSGAPVRGVHVHGTLDIEGGPAEAEGVSDEAGTATLDFMISPDVTDDEADIAVEGVIGDFSQAVRVNVNIDRSLQIRIDTDKPIYQPGQALHIRLLCLNAASRPVAALALKVRVEDPEETGAHIVDLTTNRFGIASTDWQIPGNTRLGDYRIRVQANREEAGAQASRTIKISRYDLPNFTVTVKPDRRYYLPHQNAAIEVHADYLFGKPVPRGHVRVVHESRREWNYRLQKWETEEGKSTEGDADATGRFVARIDLSELHEELVAKEGGLFDDASFTAYVRDPTSGRTEQRRFDIRVTGEPIHLYVIPSGNYGKAFISTSYADGTPASCRVTVNGNATIHTNRYGLARIAVPEQGESVEAVAEDSRGLRGHLGEPMYRRRSDGLRLRIETDKTLYHPGEPIHVEVTSSEPVPSVVVQVLHDWRLLESQWVDLSSGSAKFEIPWRDGFVHEITLGVAAGGRYDEYASRTVLFPVNQELNLKVQIDRPTYRPGEEALATFNALSPAGKPVPAALGVAVVDAAVGERARTDSESGHNSDSFGWRWFRPGTGELAGITRQDLYRLDNSKPFTHELDLLAEVMLAQEPYWPNVERSVNYQGDLADQFGGLFYAQFQPASTILESRYESDYHHPRDLATLKRDLLEAGIDFDAMRDPWGEPYRAVFETAGRFERLALVSGGPDRKFGTDDDLTATVIERAHFKPFNDRIEAALRALPAFPYSEASAVAALRAAGVNIEDFKDPWGTEYAFQFEVSRERSVLRFRSAGPDRAFGTRDDFEVDAISGSYFTETQNRIGTLLNGEKSFPTDGRSWNQLLRSSGLFPLRDPWGTSIYPVFRNSSRYTDLQRTYKAAKYGGTPQERTEILPATERCYTIYLRSAGPDRVAGTSDDFDLATYSRTEKVEVPEKPAVRVRPAGRPATENTGSIIGKVTDPTGAVIPGVTVRAVRSGAGPGTDLEYRAQSDSSGLYIVGGLLPGFYDVRIESPGFQMFLTTRVPVSRSKSVVVDATLNVGSVSEAVTVEAAASRLETASASMAMTGGVSAARFQATPRLREYFPETLLWAPSIETDSEGHSQLRFRLADNITTWKLEAIASTEAGEIGTATVDIRAFQPFFVDHVPPRVLTQGDELQLPVTVRNYLNREQHINLALRTEKWFDVTGSRERDMRIAPDASANQVFSIRATGTVVDGKQRITAQVTAQGTGPGDAIEKPITVHPDGREINQTLNAVVGDSSAIELVIPEQSIPGSVNAEIKIYPNLVSHVIDGIAGIIQRPYGCGEQTISSTYPSLLLLRYLNHLGLHDHPLRTTAQQYLQSGLERLIGYRGEDGSFTYWGRGDGDVNLTAYALTFLSQAKEFAEVDDDLIKGAREWLVKRQGKDGEWPSYAWNKEPDPRHTAYQTAVVAMALADTDAPEQVSRALRYLSAAAGRMDEPYMAAATALVAQGATQEDTAEIMLDTLRRHVRRENGLAYWNIDTNTPFYGWGLAGRLETTALAVRALAGAGLPSDQRLIESGLLFLLRNKDRYGVWWSTQATVKVLEAILAASGGPVLEDAGGLADILVNGRIVATLMMPPVREIAGPLRVDLAPYVSRGVNRISVRSSQGRSPAQLQVAAAYYVPWTEETKAADTGELRLQVAFDRTVLKPGDDVTCRVHAERVGSRGLGMMVAEIGLPPGIDVDRHSLDDAVASSGYAFSQYDILPDKVIVYVWPRAGGTSFAFRFQPRMAMQAKSAESVLYDYYNPEARVLIKPVRFRVEAGTGGK